jgi:hypothetical protein
LGLTDPLTAIIITFCFLALLIYKRVNLGITLNAAALIMALLALDLPTTWNVAVQTTIDPLTTSLVVATFGIMLLSQLYKETRVIDTLSESLSHIINNSKLIVSPLPAVMGLLPVGGGALMSAPLVEAETEKLGLGQDKKTYVNLWFRHTIFPVYPVSQILILAATLTRLTVTALIIRQIPVVTAMIITGYLIGLWKTPKTHKNPNITIDQSLELKRFLTTFLPIMATIVVVIAFGIDVSIAVFIGIAILLIIAKPNLKTCVQPLKNWAIWGITLAAYGAFLLRNVADAAGISQILSTFVNSGNVNMLMLLVLIPALLSGISGSSQGGITISVSILAGVVTFNAASASLLFMSSYLGYVVAPTHLCLVLTAEYFKCSLGKLYKYLIPSVIASFATATLVYLLF